MLECKDSIKLFSFGGAHTLSESFEEAVSTDKVKGLFKVNEGNL